MTPSAPRSIDASMIEPEVRRRRATTLLNTTTTQNVAWPMMIAGIPKFSPGIASTIEDSASAVTIPGNAIGRTSANEIVSRPKNRRACHREGRQRPERQGDQRRDDADEERVHERLAEVAGCATRC